MSQYQNELIKELTEFKTEREDADSKLESVKGSFAAEMAGGLGDDIKSTLSIPDEPRKQKKEGKISKFFKKLAQTCS